MILSTEKQIYDTNQKPNKVTREKAEEALQGADAARTVAVAAETTATEALNKNGYCSCTTAAATAEKTASLTGFQLKTGSTVHVTFANANGVANPTLNINGTGARAIRWNDAAVTAAASPWASGECVSFVYDGTYWVVAGQSNVTADNIVSGSIAADRIKANVISAVNNGTGTINADKVNAAGLTIGQSQVTGLSGSLTYAAKTATSYITNITGGGITVTGNSATADVKVTDKVRVQADSTHFTDVESTGMKVYSGSSSVPVAQFLSSGSKIASDTTHYTEFDSNSWTIYGGADSPTITAETYPVTASQATTSMAKLSISNSARTKELIRLWTNKITSSGKTFESPGIAINAYDTGNQAVVINTGRLSDGSTAGGGITVNGLGTTNAAADIGPDVVTVGGTQKAGGMVRVHYGTATISKAAQLRTYGQSGAPSLEFYNTNGTLQSWYGARKAYIKGIYDEGAVVHGHTSSYEMSLDCNTTSGYVYFYANGTAIGSIPVGSSDRRTKADIEPIQDKYKRAALKVELKDFHYDFNDEVLSGVNKLMRFGVIAQDVIEALDSEGVQEGESEFIGTLSDENSERYIVNYVPFLIARLAADEDRIKELETRLEALERRL